VGSSERGDAGFYPTWKIGRERIYRKNFNGRLCQKCLEENWSTSFEDAKLKIELSRKDYNEHHPNSFLGDETLRGFAESWELSRTVKTTRIITKNVRCRGLVQPHISGACPETSFLTTLEDTYFYDPALFEYTMFPSYLSSFSSFLSRYERPLMART
jgi:hypothetical protein